MHWAWVKRAVFWQSVGLSLLVGVAITGWVALGTAELGRFTAWWAISSGVLVAFLAGWRWWKIHEHSEDNAGWETAAAIAIAAGTLFWTLPPSEMILGGWDPGVYMHTASGIAQEGSLSWNHPDLAQLSGPAKEILTRVQSTTYEPFGGMRMLPDGHVSPQFYHYYPALMAVAWSMGGIRAALAVNPLLNVLALWAFYALAVQLLNHRRWALLATVVMAFNPTQLWQAKFCTAEVTAQFMLWSGFAVAARVFCSDERGRTWAGLWGGVALGAALLARYDSLVPLAVAGLGWLWCIRGAPDRTAVVVLLSVLALLSLHAWIHQSLVAPLYAPLGPLVAHMLIGLGVVAVLGCVVAWTAWGRRGGAIVMRSGGWVRGCVVIALGLWLAFDTFVRPHLSTHFLHDLNKILGGQDIFALAYLQDIFGLPAVLLALAGVLILCYREKRAWALVWLAACLAMLLILSYRVYNDHFMMWVSRRFIPIVIPLFCLGVAATCQSIEGLLGRWWSKGIAVAAATLALIGALAWNAPSSWAMMRMNEWPGLIRWFDRVAEALPADAVIYCDQPGFAAPLRFIYGKRSFELQVRGPGSREKLLDIMIKQMTAAPVYLLTENTEGLDDAPVEAQASFPLTSRIIHTYRRGIPRDYKGRGADMVLYRLLPLGKRTLPPRKVITINLDALEKL